MHPCPPVLTLNVLENVHVRLVSIPLLTVLSSHLFSWERRNSRDSMRSRLKSFSPLLGPCRVTRAMGLRLLCAHLCSRPCLGQGHHGHGPARQQVQQVSRNPVVIACFLSHIIFQQNVFGFMKQVWDINLALLSQTLRLNQEPLFWDKPRAIYNISQALLKL